MTGRGYLARVPRYTQFYNNPFPYYGGQYVQYTVYTGVIYTYSDHAQAVFALAVALSCIVNNPGITQGP